MQVKAHVTDVQQLDTARGHRCYTVFKTVDGSELGVWFSQSASKLPQVGDQVFLRRDSQGSLHFNINSLR